MGDYNKEDDLVVDVTVIVEASMLWSRGISVVCGGWMVE